MRGTATRWTAADIPGQQGRTILITGASTGAGLETARILAAKGAAIVLACRSPERAARAMHGIWPGAARADLQVITPDLASLASVRSAAAKLRSRCRRLDVLINNAGVMRAPKGRTAGGFETHSGANHLGHLALTGTPQAKPGQAHAPTIAVAAHPSGARPQQRLRHESERLTGVIYPLSPATA